MITLPVSDLGAPATLPADAASPVRGTPSGGQVAADKVERIGLIATDLEELPPPRRRSYLDPLLGTLCGEWAELVRGEGVWPQALNADSFTRNLLRWSRRVGAGIETTTRIEGRRVPEGSPERIWVRIADRA